MDNGLEGKYVIKNNKRLALGYTTGSCAAAAAKSAARMLFSKQIVSYEELKTPKGITLHLEIFDSKIEGNTASCAVKKYSGDDPDVTNGIFVYAKVSPGNQGNERKVTIDGGVGVGRITKPGLEQSIGEAAINKVPRKMIRDAVAEVMEEYEFYGEILVEISVPEGAAIAKKTFNPRLGIEGGISILGTSGIVEPMSEDALVASIFLEMNMHKNNGADYLVISPGNYGSDYLLKNYPVSPEKIVKCSNYIGEVIDTAVLQEYKGILFVSHIGKFIKVAGGIMNTHSRCADSRMEILAANALRAGASAETLKSVLEAVTTEEGLAILNQKGLLETTMKHVMEKIEYYLNNRAYGNLELACLVFSGERGELGRFGDVEGMLQKAGVRKEESK